MTGSSKELTWNLTKPKETCKANGSSLFKGGRIADRLEIQILLLFELLAE